MHYCFFYGGVLDGQIFSHAAPRDTFPALDFCQLGSPQDMTMLDAPASYHLYQHWPGPTAVFPQWWVYVSESEHKPAPDTLFRRLLPHILGAA